MKAQANQHRREVSFNIGDYVHIKLQPYRQTSVAFRGSLKLSPHFYGPYKVIERVGPVAYKLDLSAGSLIHDTFHVSLLCKHLGPITPTFLDLSPVVDDSTILPQPESILARREVQKGKYHPKSEVLIKWVSTPIEDAPWELNSDSRGPTPVSVLEDKDHSLFRTPTCYSFTWKPPNIVPSKRLMGLGKFQKNHVVVSGQTY
ncbi:hypothetical protein F0562_032626 [Nyssa sinensis]|uniref:Tf2-1-like SH3-like domain-containing protein n=1 Tax=Nyssa sinensis TaxID=561372 RepID=A0A5J5AQQ2_9ASTE|nr:hypothetical protein F0562_032626 [Nyssa sinensis]